MTEKFTLFDCTFGHLIYSPAWCKTCLFFLTPGPGVMIVRFGCVLNIILKPHWCDDVISGFKINDDVWRGCSGSLRVGSDDYYELNLGSVHSASRLIRWGEGSICAGYWILDATDEGSVTISDQGGTTTQQQQKHTGTPCHHRCIVQNYVCIVFGSFLYW